MICTRLATSIDFWAYVRLFRIDSFCVFFIVFKFIALFVVSPHLCTCWFVDVRVCICFFVFIFIEKRTVQNCMLSDKSTHTHTHSSIYLRSNAFILSFIRHNLQCHQVFAAILRRNDRSNENAYLRKTKEWTEWENERMQREWTWLGIVTATDHEHMSSRTHIFVLSDLFIFWFFAWSNNDRNRAIRFVMLGTWSNSNNTIQPKLTNLWAFEHKLNCLQQNACMNIERFASMHVLLALFHRLAYNYRRLSLFFANLHSISTNWTHKTTWQFFRVNSFFDEF